MRSNIRNDAASDNLKLKNKDIVTIVNLLNNLISYLKLQIVFR